MEKTRADKDNTKEKILEAAGEIFAQKGYQSTTVREICQKAGIYQLSINYHFGSKENLFKEVLIQTYKDTEEIYLMEKIKNLSPEQQLEEVIRTRVKSVFSEDKQGMFFKIVAKEISNNYEMMVGVMNNTLMEYFTFISDIFSEISDHKLSKFELNYCTYLLMSHISSFGLNEKAKILLFDTMNPTEEQLEKFIDQAKVFILAGIRHLKYNEEYKS